MPPNVQFVGSSGRAMKLASSAFARAASGREDVDPGLLLRARGGPDAAARVQGHAVDAAPAAEVVEDAPAARVPARVEVEGPQRHHARPGSRCRPRTASRPSRGDDDAVGPGQGVHDARERAVGVDAVDALLVQLEVLALRIARVGEVDAALAVDGEVVGAVEPLALIAVGEDGAPAVLLDAGHAPAARAAVAFAGDEQAVAVEGEAVGGGGVRPVHRDRSPASELQRAVRGDVLEEQVAVRMPGRPLAELRGRPRPSPTSRRGRPGSA